MNERERYQSRTDDGNDRDREGGERSYRRFMQGGAAVPLRAAPHGIGREHGEGELQGAPERGGRSVDPYAAARGRQVTEAPDDRLWERRRLRPREEEAGYVRDRDGVQGQFGEQGRFFGFGAPPEGKRPFRAPKGYKRSDERIREDVSERLAHQDELDPSEIEVHVAKGEVTLAGTVQDRREKYRAEEIADSVAGVEEVHNRLRLSRRS